MKNRIILEGINYQLGYYDFSSWTPSYIYSSFILPSTDTYSLGLELFFCVSYLFLLSTLFPSISITVLSNLLPTAKLLLVSFCWSFSIEMKMFLIDLYTGSFADW